MKQQTTWQLGFFDQSERLKKLDELGDVLADLDRVVDFEIFRQLIENALAGEPRKSAAGRPALDVVFMFKTLILQRLFNLSDERAEFHINDSLSYQRFLGLSSNGAVPDYTSIWLFREKLTRAGIIKSLFDLFAQKLAERGLITKTGTIIDATIVEVPRQHNTRKENEIIKHGGVPEKWKTQPGRLCHKDVDARWKKKNGVSFYGYEDHTVCDVPSKFIRDYEVTDASVHDSRPASRLITNGNRGEDLFADSAYKSAEFDAWLAECGVHSHVHDKAARGHPLPEGKRALNRLKSKIRCLIEHIYGCMENSMGGIFLRTIGIKRARTGIGLMNLTYNMLRLVQWVRLGLAPAWPCCAQKA